MRVDREAEAGAVLRHAIRELVHEAVVDSAVGGGDFGCVHIIGEGAVGADAQRAVMADDIDGHRAEPDTGDRTQMHRVAVGVMIVGKRVARREAVGKHGDGIR